MRIDIDAENESSILIFDNDEDGNILDTKHIADSEDLQIIQDALGQNWIRLTEKK